MKKVIFIINAIQQQRCLKRVEEFIDHGYEVKAYGFSRSEVVPTQPKRFEIEVLGHIDNGIAYAKRLWIMYKALRPVFLQHKNEDVIYYYFLLDVAMVCLFISNKPYIYEESDLMQTYLSFSPLRYTLDLIDRCLIRHSVLTTMTSEGFLQYHFPQEKPTNICLVPNRLNPRVTELPRRKHPTDIHHLKIAFVGGARFDSIVHIADTILTHFPQHEFHFYGTISDHHEDFKRIQDTYSNVRFHGKFTNPDDLPAIYENIDLLVATYDTKYENVRYAEPNKLYEAIYFLAPILVSRGTFLAEKVKRLGIGFDIDPLNDNEIITFFNHLQPNDIQRCADNCKRIDTQNIIDRNPDLFNKL